MVKKIIGLLGVMLIIVAGLLGALALFKYELFSVYFETEKQKDMGSFTVHYNRGDEKKAEMMEQAYPAIVKLEEKLIKTDKKAMEDAKLHIYLASDKNGQDDEYDTKGYYDALSVLYLNNALEEKEFINTFSHEMSHFYLNEYNKQIGLEPEQIPNWLEEGLAMSFAQRIEPEPIQEAATEDIPLMDVQPEATDNGVPAYHEGDYILMMFAVEYLIHHHGEGIITDLLKETARSGDIDAAFEKLTKEKLDTLHEKFADQAEFREKVERLLRKGKGNEAQKALISHFDERGFYFNGADHVLDELGQLYANQGNYKDALPLFEKKAEYMDDPYVYKQVSETAEHTDQEKSIHYAKKAVESAKRNDSYVQLFETFLEEQKDKVKAVSPAGE